MKGASPIDPALRQGLASDLRLFALLHDREPEQALLEELRTAPTQVWLTLVLRSDDARGALAFFDQALRELPHPIDDQTLDDLAADHASIYLTHACRAAPMESVWLHDEALTLQEPMFAIRRWYEHYGLAAEDWRRRSDDHLVLQLQFLAHLFTLDAPHALGDAARFMDRHILLWIGDFARRVAQRCHTPYFAGLALTTSAYLEELRDLLTEITGEARFRPAAEAKGQKATEVEGPYLPGIGPGW